jgi:DNA gyrase inhibitor GyrI
MIKNWVLLIATLLPVAVIVVACKATRAGYAEPKYRSIKQDGHFSIREYDPIVVAETPVKSGDGMNSGFGRLFKFITGENSSKQKISMTTPVLMSAGTNATMAFVMPADATSASLPKPADGGVVIKTIDGGRFAVFRFSGNRELAGQNRAAEQLFAWAKANGYKPGPQALFAFYDPPWIPGFLRRNEAMVRIVAY